MHGLQRRLLCAQWWIHVAGDRGSSTAIATRPLRIRLGTRCNKSFRQGTPLLFVGSSTSLGRLRRPTSVGRTARNFFETCSTPPRTPRSVRMVLLLVLEDENVMRMLGLRERSNRASRSGESPGATAAE